MTDETLREIEQRRHELNEQRRAWRDVQKYIDGIVDALDVQINRTFDEWEAAFNQLYPDMTSEKVKELVAEAESTINMTE
jgi:Zn/Cd-binding protein ZinT